MLFLEMLSVHTVMRWATDTLMLLPASSWAPAPSFPRIRGSSEEDSVAPGPAQACPLD